MKVLLRLERIGDDAHTAMRFFERDLNFAGYRQYMKTRKMGGPNLMPAVRCMTEAGGLGRFLRFRKDYSESNGPGSRGVMAVYELEMGHYYWVRERTSWKNSNEYFICAGRNGIRIVEEEEAVEWAKERLAWM